MEMRQKDGGQQFLKLSHVTRHCLDFYYSCIFSIPAPYFLLKRLLTYPLISLSERKTTSSMGR